MVSELERELRNIDIHLGYLTASLDRGRKDNEVINELDSTEFKIGELKKYLDKRYAECKYMQKAIQKFASEYREQRIAFLEREIELNLSLLLPEENFKVKIDFSNRNGEPQASLYIGKDHGSSTQYYLARGQNGNFVKQVISFSVIYSINSLRGSSFLAMDEALASGDQESLLDLTDLFNRLLENGLQCIIIEHKEEQYRNLPKTMFNLKKDRKTGEAFITSVENNS